MVLLNLKNKKRAGNWYGTITDPELKRKLDTGEILGGKTEYDEAVDGTEFGGMMKKWEQGKTTPEEEIKLFQELEDSGHADSIMTLPMRHRMNQLMQEHKIKFETSNPDYQDMNTKKPLAGIKNALKKLTSQHPAYAKYREMWENANWVNKPLVAEFFQKGAMIADLEFIAEVYGQGLSANEFYALQEAITGGELD